VPVCDGLKSYRPIWAGMGKKLVWRLLGRWTHFKGSLGLGEWANHLLSLSEDKKIVW